MTCPTVSSSPCATGTARCTSPPPHCVKFKDGNRMNCSLDNLYLVSRADHARETRAALSPEQKKEIMRKVHDGRRASIRRDKLRLKWGLEPEGKIVKRLR